MTASGVCARCGNFMCAGCSVSSTEAQCPTCRSLNTGAFPYDGNADLSTLFSHSTDAFQRDAAMLVVATVIFFAFVLGGALVANVISSVMGSILGVRMGDELPSASNLAPFIATFAIGQVVGTAVNLVVQAVALVGLYRVLMDALIGRKVDIGRMFSQLHLVGQFVLLQLILTVGIGAAMMVLFGVPAGLAIGRIYSAGSASDFSQLMTPGVLGGFVLATFVLMALLVIAMPVMVFSVPELIVGNCSAFEAIRRAWRLGEGQRLRLLGYGFVVGLISLGGMLACGVGLLAAVPVGYMLLLSLFLALRNRPDFPAAVH